MSNESFVSSHIEALDEAPRQLAFGNREVKSFIDKGPGDETLYQSANRYFPDFEFRPVETQEEFEAAAHIAYKEYVGHGYTRVTPVKVKFSAFHALPSTITLIGIYRRTTVIGTLSAVVDSPIGLPMESTYHEELEQLRRAGRRLAEATSLAVDTRLVSSGAFQMSLSQRRLFMFHLIRAMYDALRSGTKVDELVACFHPKHDGFYKFLDMAPLGELKAHDGAAGSPALARHLDMKAAAGTANMTARLMFGPMIPSPAKPAFGLSPDGLRMLIRDLDLFSTLPPAALSYLQTLYPSYDFSSARLTDGPPAPSAMDSAALAPLSPLHREANRVAAAFRKAGFLSGTRVLLLGMDERVGSVVKAAAALNRMDARESSARPAVWTDDMKRFAPHCVIVDDLRSLEEIPSDILRRAAAVIVTESERNREYVQDEIHQALFSPIVSDTAFLFWDEFLNGRLIRREKN